MYHYRMHCLQVINLLLPVVSLLSNFLHCLDITLILLLVEFQVFFSISFAKHNFFFTFCFCDRFLYLHDIEKERWLTLMNDPDYRSYTVMSVAPAQQSCVVLGNIHGKLRIFLAAGKLQIISVHLFHTSC